MANYTTYVTTKTTKFVKNPHTHANPLLTNTMTALYHQRSDPHILFFNDIFLSSIRGEEGDTWVGLAVSGAVLRRG
jgi:hypothetical protein